MCAELENTPHRSFSLRMKSTLTSRGKSVNINASIYRVSFYSLIFLKFLKAKSLINTISAHNEPYVSPPLFLPFINGKNQ